MKMMVLLLLALGVSVGIATFIENDWDTPAAKILVFNATWFEMLLFVFMINLIGGMIKYNVFQKGKFSILTFHLAFTLIILGAGISRFTGFEGTIEIQEGTSNDIMYTAEPYLQAKVITMDEGGSDFSTLLWLSEGTPRHNRFNYSFEVPKRPPVHLEYTNYYSDVEYDVLPGRGKGLEYIRIKIPKQEGGGMDTVYLKSGFTRMTHAGAFAFNDPSESATVEFTTGEDGLIYFKSSGLTTVLDQAKLRDWRMKGGEGPMPSADSLLPNARHKLQVRYVHATHGAQFVYESHYNDAIPSYVKAREEGTGFNVLLAKAKYKDEVKAVALRGGHKNTPWFQQVEFSDVAVVLGYGAMQRRIPFDIYCKDFRLEKYPGSQSPSSFECDVIIQDRREGGKDIEANIFMNNVLDYSGYRFFQSSFKYSGGAPAMNGAEPDTTVLSVNHDAGGTWVTYLGYLIMAIGFIWSLINKNSRFSMLRRKLKDIRKERLGTAVIGLLLTFTGFSAEESSSVVTFDEGYKNTISRLIVQDFEGRFSTFQTHAIDVLHKVKKKRHHKNMDAVQVYLNMLLTPPKWFEEKLLFVKIDPVRQLIRMEGKYASMANMMDASAMKDGDVYLREDIFEAYQRSHQKRDRDKTEYDKELIKVIHRYEVLYMALTGRFLRVYPAETLENNQWISLHDIQFKNHQGPDVKELTKIQENFLVELHGNGLKGEGKTEALTRLMDYQREKDGDILPSETKVNLENTYNKLNIFFSLLLYYSTIGLIFITLLMFDVFKPGLKWVNVGIKVCFWLITLGTLYHLFGLGLRWYVVGHAPWSNGYEALIFISFVAMLAGTIFYRSSRFTLGGTAVLSALILGVAHGANTDPQLTNLVPVLKSVWLVIHVAIITGSYAFLGLGAILSLKSLFLYIIRKPGMKGRINSTINELNYTAELTMTVGLYMAAIGTFLGGVWANESWGRYWGWDPKETWALIIVITYALILHLRFIPFLKNKIVLAVMGLWAYATVIMTYFGVNFYLTKGLHSYAAGAKSYLPSWAIYTIIVLSVITAIAIWQNRRYGKHAKSLAI